MSHVDVSEVAGLIRQCVFLSRRFAAHVVCGDTHQWDELCGLHDAACTACLNCSAAGPLRALLEELHDWDAALLPRGVLPAGFKKGMADFRPHQLRVHLSNAADSLSQPSRIPQR